MTADVPPSFNPNTVELVSTKDGKITNVNLYPGRAEITRVYKFSLRPGINQVKISALPTHLDHDSLRVEGRGAATIHDVTVAPAAHVPAPSTSNTLETLLGDQKRVQKAISRCKAASSSLEKYFSAITPDKVDGAQLGSLIEIQERENERLDERLLQLEAQLESIEQKLKEERQRIASNTSTWNSELKLTATIGVFAEGDGEAEIALIYAVRGANWQASYDVRVDMQVTENPVTLIYKAAISQSTGEAWEDVPLTLETVTPTFGVGLPTLNSCRLSAFKPPVPRRESVKASAPRRMAARRIAPSVSSEDEDMGFALFDDAPSSPLQPTMARATLAISNFGGLSTSYQVPGLISIPNDGQAHSVTIVELKLGARMSWVAIPRVDTRVHLKAQIKNASDYTLLPGGASVYVDGSFISKSTLPAVSPQENFDCPLGLDPAVRVAYHPLVQKSSSSGFYNKSTIKTSIQRITVYNTKPITVDSLKIIDRIPVSEDSQITVKLINPPLNIPSASTLPSSSLRVERTSSIIDEQDKSGNGKLRNMKTIAPPPLKVSEGVLAQWDGADECTDVSALGKDGKLNWLCSLPPQGKITVSLHWEESSPVNVTVVSRLG